VNAREQRDPKLAVAEFDRVVASGDSAALDGVCHPDMVTPTSIPAGPGPSTVFEDSSIRGRPRVASAAGKRIVLGDFGAHGRCAENTYRLRLKK
jgi:hypothetical protein